ncbi:uncharacterized protein BX663DRAFT_499331 [Cokeromyces recurvatus]|uniref:uncharacterized protein n=1 Tax=Cokeromyces recurvatus TaxID=90255 RepID=UPI002220235A|nr:uncharacterized protein BX663DRAFT_499331 [Cokeromyces recurvatus]KAI7906231.1 hypothetical protein BX663DRAFT_499331 [Cokeromyces recurvatus]
MKNHMSTHETQHYVSSIPVKTKKDTYLFRDASSALHPPKRPKITSENISTLSPVATIINPYNEHLSPEHKHLAKQQFTDQENMVSLKQYPTTYNMLKPALDAELPNLPHFLWTFVQPNDIMAHNATLIKIIQFVLTDFCSKCHCNAFYQSKFERTCYDYSHPYN